jgi:hypothetical protein
MISVFAYWNQEHYKKEHYKTKRGKFTRTVDLRLSFFWQKFIPFNFCTTSLSTIIGNIHGAE